MFALLFNITIGLIGAVVQHKAPERRNQYFVFAFLAGAARGLLTFLWSQKKEQERLANWAQESGA